MTSQNGQTVHLASVLYGVVALLTALLAVKPDEFTVRNVIWGGTAVGLAAMLTYYFKEIVHEEADHGVMLDAEGYLRLLRISSPVLAFPIAAVLVALSGLSFGIDPSLLIAGIFYLGIITVGVVAFAATYRVTGSLGAGFTRTAVWLGLCVLLYVAKSLA